MMLTLQWQRDRGRNTSCGSLMFPATPGFNMHLSRRPPPLHQHTWGTCEAGSGHNQEWALEEAHTLESDWTTRVNKGC